MDKEFINCGERTLQVKYRVALRDICQKNGIGEGDIIEVYIKKVEKKLAK